MMLAGVLRLAGMPVLGLEIARLFAGARPRRGRSLADCSFPGSLHQLQDQAARDRLRLDDSGHGPLAQAIDRAPAPSDQAMAGFIVIIKVVRQTIDEYQPVRARLVQADEQAEAGDARDPARENLADAPGKEAGDIAIDGIALGRGGPAFSRGDMLADGFEPGTCARRESAVAELAAGDERAMNKEVGIAPDRRGEVAVTRQSKTEMTDIDRAIDGLRLAAQDELMDHFGEGAGRGLLEKTGEHLRPDDLAAGKHEPQGGD